MINKLGSLPSGTVQKSCVFLIIFIGSFIHYGTYRIAVTGKLQIPVSTEFILRFKVTGKNYKYRYGSTVLRFILEFG